MKKTCRFLIGLTVSTLLPATAIAQKVAYDYSRTENFRSVKTFAFKDTRPIDAVTTETTTYDSPFVIERTHAAIASQLEMRGLKQVKNNPDAYVTSRRTFKTEQVLYGPSGWGPYGWGWYGWGWGYGGPWYTEDIIKGTLIIDLVDADTGALLWRGLREKTVHPHAKPEKRTEQVYEDVAKIFKKYPWTGPVATSGFGSPAPTDRDESEGRD
jgi:Domain of unknown function (DUF4136)